MIIPLIILINAVALWVVFAFDYLVLYALLPVLVIISLMALAFLFQGRGWRRIAVMGLYAVGLFVWANVLGHYYLETQKLWEVFIPDHNLGWKAKANLTDVTQESKNGPFNISTNAEGFRGLWPQGPPAALAVQGDSNIFGFGLAEADTLPAQLSCELGRPVVNLGVSGYDLHQYYLQYQKVRPKLGMSRRLVVVSVGNDYACSALITPYFYPRPYLEFPESGGMRVSYPSAPLALQEYGLRFVPALAAFNAQLAPYEKGRRLLADLRLPRVMLDLPLARWGLQRLLKGERGRGLMQRLARPGSPPDAAPPKVGMEPWYGHWAFLRVEQWPEPYRDFLPYFGKLLAAIQSQGDNPLIVLLPPREQVIPAARQALQAALQQAGFPAQAVFMEALPQEIARLCEEAGLPYLDPAPAFQAHAAPEALFQPQDHHLSPQGTGLLSRLIAAKLAH
jgi:hypothetical protein